MSITLEHVSKTYTTGEVETKALIDINLEIADGEMLVILGTSGSGKSTLLNVISGLDSATSGTITASGVDLTQMSDSKLTKFRRDNLGFVFQQYHLMPNLNVIDNVALGAAIAPNPLDINSVLQDMGILELAKKYPSQLSGGQQQRVSIARSVVKRPKIIFCDEPTGALDEKTGRLVLSLIAKLNREHGTTTVIITHMPSIAQMADRVIHINSGRITKTIINTRKVQAADITWQ